MRKSIYNLLWFLVIGIGLYVLFQYIPLVELVKEKLQPQPISTPCSTPITFRLGPIDPRFKVTKKQVFDAIQTASSQWEKAEGKPLFTFASDGSMPVSFVYDSRQEITDKLKSIGFVIENTKASYQSLQSKYQALQKVIDKKNKQFKADFEAYSKRNTAYEQEVQSWNSKGGAPAQDVVRLGKERTELAVIGENLSKQQDAINAQIETLNNMASALNRLAKKLNINTGSYNNIATDQGKEFEEGLYRIDKNGKAIDIYEFHDQDELIRVLTHELGHALGIEHIDNPEAIMYRLNESKNKDLTPDDIAALKKVCEGN